jgi:hypothetical protein
VADFEHYWIDFIVCPVLALGGSWCWGLFAYLKFKRWPVRKADLSWLSDSPETPV